MRDTSFMVKNFKGGPMFDGTTARVRYDAPDAQGFDAFAEIREGVLEFANLLLMPRGSLIFEALADRGGSPFLLDYELPKSGGTITFSAVQKARTAKIRAKTQREAIQKTGAQGSVGEDLEVVNLGGEANGEAEWQLTWGSEDFEVKQV